MIRSGHFLPVWLWLTLLLASPVLGQSPDGPVSNPTASSDDTVPEGLQVTTAGAPVGFRRMAPDRWGLVGVEAVNASDRDGAVEAEVFIDGHADQRFARDVWVPAQSIRRSWVPIHLPQELADAGALDVIGRGEAQADASQPFRSLLAVSDDRLLMASIGDRFGEAGAGEDTTAEAAYLERAEEDAAYESVMALRGAHGLGRRMLVAHERLLPPTFEGWDSIDCLIIAGDHLADDSAAQTAVRRWLSSGGRIWLQLNHTSPETARRLLGDAFRVEVVDRVPLPQFLLTGPGADLEGLQVEPAVEQPPELVRVVAEGVEVLHEADGWPASFVIPFGRGEVLVTTLDAHGWMRRRAPGDPPASSPQMNTKYVATDPLQNLALRLFSAPGPELPDDLQHAYLTQRIGYEVPPRGVILAILLSFCGSIGVVGGVLAHRQRLEHLPWLTLAAAILASGLVVAMGWSGRQAVPPTVAELQTIRVLPQTDGYVGSGTLARYTPEQSRVSLASSQGGRIDPEMPDLAGQIRRLVWTDLDQWHWRGTTLPPGVQLFATESTGSLESPVRAIAQFGPEGLEGQFKAGPFRGASDALIAVPYALPLAADLAEDGRFVAGPADQLAEGQYVDAALLNEEQRRRQQLYAGWFASQTESKANPSPQLMVWTEPLPEHFTWPENMQQTGAALVSVPVAIRRTPADVAVAIPASFVNARSVRGRQGLSQVFDNRTQEWISPSSSATTTRLRFEMPGAVLPMSVDRAVLKVDCSIPSRVLEISTTAGGQRETILRRSNPAGILEVTIEDPRWLQLDDRGGLVLEFEIGELLAEVDEKTLANSGWSIHSTRLDVYGRTLPPSTASAEPLP